MLLYISVFQPFLWSGTLCSKFDCSRNPWAQPEICLGAPLNFMSKAKRVGKRFLESSRKLEGLGERCKSVATTRVFCKCVQNAFAVGDPPRTLLEDLYRKCVYWPQMSFSSRFSIWFGRTVMPLDFTEPRWKILLLLLLLLLLLQCVCMLWFVGSSGGYNSWLSGWHVTTAVLWSWRRLQSVVRCHRQHYHHCCYCYYCWCSSDKAG